MTAASPREFGRRAWSASAIAPSGTTSGTAGLPRRRSDFSDKPFFFCTGTTEGPTLNNTTFRRLGGPIRRTGPASMWARRVRGSATSPPTGPSSSRSSTLPPRSPLTKDQAVGTGACLHQKVHFAIREDRSESILATQTVRFREVLVQNDSPYNVAAPPFSAAGFGDKMNTASAPAHLRSSGQPPQRAACAVRPARPVPGGERRRR